MDNLERNNQAKYNEATGPCFNSNPLPQWRELSREDMIEQNARVNRIINDTRNQLNLDGRDNE